MPRYNAKGYSPLRQKGDVKFSGSAPAFRQDRNVPFRGKVKVKPKKNGGKGSVSGGKPAGNVGPAKGDLRLLNGKWVERRFTYKQRQTFRDRRKSDLNNG